MGIVTDRLGPEAALRRPVKPTSSIALAIALALLAPACADPGHLPPGVGPEDDYADGDGDETSGNGTETGNGPSGSDPPSCDDPATCEYDKDTSCGGKPYADPTVFPACPADICAAGGHCVPTSLVPGDQAAALSICDGTSKCVPDRFIEAGGLFTPPSCTSIGGAEGRCLSSCLAEVSSQAGYLPSGGCQSGEICVPCFDPFDGAPSGACALSCDAGPTEPAKPLPSCCVEKGGGTCVPVAVVGTEQADKLDEDECAAAGLSGAVCVPNIILDAALVDVPFIPVECVTGPVIQELGLGSEGGCLPECIPIVDALPVSQQNCADGFKCVPCIDLTGDGTGACDP